MRKFLPRASFRVGRSSTGKGLFATIDIPKGTYVIEYTGRPATSAEMRRDSGKYLFWTSSKTMINGNISSNLARYINHSCVPNCEAVGPRGRIYIVSTKNISAGDEITYDYGDEYYNKHLGRDVCRCKKCSTRRVSR